MKITRAQAEHILEILYLAGFSVEEAASQLVRAQANGSGRISEQELKSGAFLNRLGLSRYERHRLYVGLRKKLQVATLVANNVSLRKRGTRSQYDRDPQPSPGKTHPDQLVGYSLAELINPSQPNPSPAPEYEVRRPKKLLRP